tara:strand:- start:9031 stop:9483 length:453 start_codon:yes stop_codon:yes gene_type:complete
MTDLFLDAEEQKQKEVEKELKNTHPIAQAHEAKDIATGTRIKVGDLSQTTKDFLTEVNKEKEELEMSMQEAFRQRDERVAREKKKDIQKILEANKITNFKTPEQEMAQRLEDDKYKGTYIHLQKMTPEEEDRNAGVERDKDGNVKSEETR